MANASLRACAPISTSVPQIEDKDWIDEAATQQATRAANARKLSGRRRYIDPTTCERDYSAAELEFMSAMQKYKETSRRMFPTCSEVLEVLSGLGYEKPAVDLNHLA